MTSEDSWTRSQKNIELRLSQNENRCDSFATALENFRAVLAESDKNLIQLFADQKVWLTQVTSASEMKRVESESAMREFLSERFRQQDSQIAALSTASAVLGVQVSPRTAMITAIIALLAAAASILPSFFR
jgi:hypothetical protein